MKLIAYIQSGSVVTDFEFRASSPHVLTTFQRPLDVWILNLFGEHSQIIGPSYNFELKSPLNRQTITETSKELITPIQPKKKDHRLVQNICFLRWKELRSTRFMKVT